jgi:hypothetical protein
MQEEKTEGIVLRSQEYKERQRIVTLFTPQGVLSLIVKGVSPKQSHLLALTTPFSHGEYHFLRGRSELMRFQDGTVLNEHLVLRENLEWLRTAGALSQAIMRSQMPGKAAPQLFELYKAYHGHVCRVKQPQALLASFYIKLLKHEGVWHDPASGGELSDFSLAEREQLHLLSRVERFSSLNALLIPNALLQKIFSLIHALSGGDIPKQLQKLVPASVVSH